MATSEDQQPSAQQDAITLMKQGRELYVSGEWAAAEQVFLRVLQADARNADAWCYLGIVRHNQGKFPTAIHAYNQALQVQPGSVVPLNNKGNSLQRLYRFSEAIDCFDRVIAVRNDFVQAYQNKGMTLLRSGRIDEATDTWQQGLAVSPQEAGLHVNLGIGRLLKGQFEAAWPEYEWRLKQPTSAVHVPGNVPAWDGSSLDGRSILLASEQGLGDTIQFIRYAAELKRRYDCRVVAWCQRSLRALLTTCAAIDEFCPRNEPPPVNADCYAALMSLPGLLGTTTVDEFPASVPYLSADDVRVDVWRQELAKFSGVKVGINWCGTKGNETDFLRSFPLEAMNPLGAFDGVTFFSLQKFEGLEQLEDAPGRMRVVPLSDRLDNEGGAFLDTAAVMRNLDLVVTCDTAVAHLAGALGVPVWLALAYVPDWRWLLDREDSPWYPSMRLFRQKRPGDWESAFALIAEALRIEHPELAIRPPESYRIDGCSGVNRLCRGREGLVLYNLHDVYIGRSLELYGEFSHSEAEVFEQGLTPGMTVVEAGANIGTHTLVLSRCVGDEGRVYAFEPQRVVFQTLCANMALNSRTNVDCRCQALGDSRGEITVPPLDYHATNNFGGLGLRHATRGERVARVTIDSLQLQRCDFIKVDVEGMELDVLKGAQQTIQRHQPVLYVENDRKENSAPLIAYLQSLGYQLFWHLPRMFNPNNWFQNSDNVFGNIVSVNMLCIHSSRPFKIDGLRHIESPDSDWKQPGSSM